MNAQERWEHILPLLQHIFIGMDEKDQDTVIEALMHARRVGGFAYERLAVWQCPDTNVGGIWTTEDVDRVLDCLKESGFELGHITLERKREMLSNWYDFVSQNELQVWEDFVHAQVEYFKWLNDNPTNEIEPNGDDR